jgi:Fibrinogen beta and gamma chains, C-terminal globular domain
MATVFSLLPLSLTQTRRVCCAADSFLNIFFYAPLTPFLAGVDRYAEYSSFKLYSEREQYKLEIGGYTGNAGDSLNDPWYGSNLSPFSTYNR